ncbi:MAG TPA: hypothetical protein VFW95_03130 [Candidatus Limnocylindria bacterium]|nr:hypothetical protein [Candidatus Limnocylindria bacterium]
MDEPVPVRRALLGCGALAVIGIVAVLLVRPAIFTFAEPRDDSVVTMGTLSAATSTGPTRHDVILARSYGWDGEQGAGDGRVQMSVIVSPVTLGGIAAVAAASPVEEDCPLEIRPDRLVDCDDRQWTLDGLPLDPADPPLDRFPINVEDGNVVVDLTRTLPPP